MSVKISYTRVCENIRNTRDRVSNIPSFNWFAKYFADYKQMHFFILKRTVHPNEWIVRDLQSERLKFRQVEEKENGLYCVKSKGSLTYWPTPHGILEPSDDYKVGSLVGVLDVYGTCFGGILYDHPETKLRMIRFLSWASTWDEVFNPKNCKGSIKWMVNKKQMKWIHRWNSLQAEFPFVILEEHIGVKDLILLVWSYCDSFMRFVKNVADSDDEEEEEEEEEAEKE
jgi:hypothetical protein